MAKRKWPAPSAEILELMEENGVSTELFNYRTRYRKPKMTYLEAATKKVDNSRKPSKYGKWPRVAAKKKIPLSAFYARVRLGWSYEHAATLPLDNEGAMTDEQAAIAKSKDLTRKQVRSRLYEGWPIEKAISTPIQEQYKHAKYIKIAESKGISRDTYYNRISRGWSKKHASETIAGGLPYLTTEQNKTFMANELHSRTVNNRIMNLKMSVEDAITLEYGEAERRR